MLKGNLIQFVQKNKATLILWALFVIAGQFVKINFSSKSSVSLSCITVFLPVIAYFFSFSRALPLLALGWIATHFAWPIPITLGIPTLFATLSWHASKNKRSDVFFHVALSALCMILFIAGCKEAWAYSLYWLIPILAAFLPLGIFGRALKSTFTAHALGSVIWVYVVPMTSAQWLSLIPVVAMERLLIVSLMLGMIGIMRLSLNLKAGLQHGQLQDPFRL